MFCGLTEAPQPMLGIHNNYSYLIFIVINYYHMRRVFTVAKVSSSIQVYRKGPYGEYASPCFSGLFDIFIVAHVLFTKQWGYILKF